MQRAWVRDDPVVGDELIKVYIHVRVDASSAGPANENLVVNHDAPNHDVPGELAGA